MPYITQTARKAIDEGGLVTTAGELNYVITKHFLDTSIGLATAMWNIQEEIDKYVSYRGLSYGVINDVVGVLECSRREIARRRGVGPLDLFSDLIKEFYDAVAAPYEDKKIQENGDVF